MVMSPTPLITPCEARVCRLLRIRNNPASGKMPEIVDVQIDQSRLRNFCQRRPRSVIGPSPFLLGKTKRPSRSRPLSLAITAIDA